MAKKKSSNSTLGLAVFVTVMLLLGMGLYLVFRRPEIQQTVPKAKQYFTYPTDYEEYVIKYSNEYDIDARYIFAVIRTESSFVETAESEVGARGLMQIMPDAFDWIQFRLDDDRGLTFDDMYTPEYNIQYGTYMLSYLYEKFGSYELASAAYHQGMNAVSGWIDDGTIDPEHFSVDENLDAMPSDLTRDYIYKVMKAFDKYKENAQLEEDINNGKQQNSSGDPDGETA
ncbi:soluble lytic murein transglycosylase [Ruminococcus sp. YE71]|uniref:lytic transglycosylase domain-containing protein n=1 Tax=unclassified Ruminococcus TaxID=2608920 RepID=UPI0008906E5C|nr:MULTISPECIES: lytic transglycosylase domain-containing protein [unclassified Ruminococcus]SDA27299.1 soluble lytic murein transglycosylase [Ruminococcus sp. YE78]SFW45244.1 soluble lytic murein transglycosylase [Ruminococcus sp. YE71]